MLITSTIWFWPRHMMTPACLFAPFSTLAWPVCLPPHCPVLSQRAGVHWTRAKYKVTTLSGMHEAGDECYLPCSTRRWLALVYDPLLGQSVCHLIAPYVTTCWYPMYCHVLYCVTQGNKGCGEEGMYLPVPGALERLEYRDDHHPRRRGESNNKPPVSGRLTGTEIPEGWTERGGLGKRHVSPKRY